MFLGSTLATLGQLFIMIEGFLIPNCQCGHCGEVLQAQSAQRSANYVLKNTQKKSIRVPLKTTKWTLAKNESIQNKSNPIFVFHFFPTCAKV